MNPAMLFSALNLLKGEGGTGGGVGGLLTLIKQNPEVTPLAALTALAMMMPRTPEARSAYVEAVGKVLDGLAVIMGPTDPDR